MSFYGLINCSKKIPGYPTMEEFNCFKKRYADYQNSFCCRAFQFNFMIFTVTHFMKLFKKSVKKIIAKLYCASEIPGKVAIILYQKQNS